MAMTDWEPKIQKPRMRLTFHPCPHCQRRVAHFWLKSTVRHPSCEEK